MKKTREELIVGIRTIDGTAKGGEDFTSLNEVVKISYLEYKVPI
jgi:hypothetical protein